ncbi:MAG TPA: ABC-F type ribosomal protection protein [Clostridiaceae bacterium]
MNELVLSGIKKYLDATLVLKDINFQVYNGERVGIVGVNGSGKTTILKLIAGLLTIDRDDKGSISITKGAKAAYLEQIPTYPEGYKVSNILNLAFEELFIIEEKLRKLEKAMETLEGERLEKTLKEYSTLQQDYEVKGGYEREEKLSKVCKGLKLEDDFILKEFSILSGGEKTTVVLGKILLEESDILLLDEPTNHLDVESMEWLEGYLKNYKGIVIIVSHDRYFLDSVVTKIVEIEDGSCSTYKGNYSDYIKQKDEELLVEFDQFKEQQKQIKAMEKAVKDLRDWALRADNNKFFKRAVSIQKKLDKMERIDKPVLEKQNIKLNFELKERSGNEVIKADDLYKCFQDRVIFEASKMLIKYKERVALVGSNGSGKTTFIRMLLGEDLPDGGTVTLGSSVRLAYLPQSISFTDEDSTVLECFREDFDILEGKAREYLSKFMFFGKSVFKKVGQLSGGERVRLKLSKLLYGDINLLILDEPTNHLDIDSIETLEDALEGFKGTIFFVSHDRYFINRICNRVIVIEDNSFKTYAGNYEYYKSEKEKVTQAIIIVPVVKKEKLHKVKVVDEGVILKLELLKLEKRIAELEAEIKELEMAMSISDISYEELSKLHFKKEALTKELEDVMESWVNLDRQYI